jgi:hypothetical protein
MMSLFAFSPSPFSKIKFAAYMLGLLVIIGISFNPSRPHAPEPVVLKQDDAQAPGTAFQLLRFGRASDELLDELPEIGIPWFLRRAGVTGAIDASDPDQLVITLTLDGKTFGRYIERVQPIDADRTRLYLAFEPTDMEIVRRLAAPVDTTLDPVSLLRVTGAEQIRSSLDYDEFRVSVLKPDTPGFMVDAALGAIRQQPRNTDSFPLDDREMDRAAIRRAYHDEAVRAGAAAPKL